MTTLFIYTLCLLLTQTPMLLANKIRIWSNKPRSDNANSYDSQEILPYTSSKFADRNPGINEEIDQDKLLSLFTNTKREALAKADEIIIPDMNEIRKLQKVKDAEAFLSEMLRVLHTLFSKKVNGKPTKFNTDGNIAWSYYDDLGK